MDIYLVIDNHKNISYSISTVAVSGTKVVDEYEDLSFKLNELDLLNNLKEFLIRNAKKYGGIETVIVSDEFALGFLDKVFVGKIKVFTPKGLDFYQYCNIFDIPEKVSVSSVRALLIAYRSKTMTKEEVAEEKKALSVSKVMGNGNNPDVKFMKQVQKPKLKHSILYGYDRPEKQSNTVKYNKVQDRRREPTEAKPVNLLFVIAIILIIIFIFK